MADERTVSILESYGLNAHGLDINVRIIEIPSEFIPIYEVTIPGLGNATRVLLLSLRTELLSLVPIDPTRIEDKEYVDELNTRYVEASNLIIDKYLPGTKSDVKRVLIAYIINIMLGLGDLEAPLADDRLEEVVVNTSKEPVWVFHRKHGWCKTNISVHDESTIYESTEEIGRRVGRQITNLSPLMDAELPDGSRVNATLYPISQKGNTITIRKFAKNPWTMVALVSNKTVSSEVAGMIWACIQNEISLLISGGTASGKTSFLNAMSVFMPPNRRIISVEETRELTLPSFLHWVPMLTRQPNPEGKGEITLYNLMINALRQRPDIMLVGEIRTQKDAETLFEAIHTGHSVYGTVHADNASDTIIRMTNPPIGIPKILIDAIGGLVSLFRHRRLGMRRVLEFGEVLKSGDVNVVYRWNIRNDTFMQVSELSRLAETIMLYGGYTRKELLQDINDKQVIIEWMNKNQVINVDEVGTVVSEYYRDAEKVLKMAKADVKYSREKFTNGVANP